MGWPIALHGLVHFLDTTGPSLTKVVYVSHVTTGVTQLRHTTASQVWDPYKFIQNPGICPFCGSKSVDISQTLRNILVNDQISQPETVSGHKKQMIPSSSRDSFPGPALEKLDDEAKHS